MWLMLKCKLKIKEFFNSCCEEPGRERPEIPLYVKSIFAYIVHYSQKNILSSLYLSGYLKNVPFVFCKNTISSGKKFTFGIFFRYFLFLLL